MMKLVSVIIPTYNCANYIGEAIDSVLKQTYPHIEIIVVDDGSIDNTRDIVEKYGDKIKYIYKENGGLSSARNKGILAANGEYIGFLDADDIFMPLKLENQINLLERNSDTGTVSSWRYFINERGDLLPQKTKFHVDRDVLKQLLLNNSFLCSTVLLKKEVIDAVGLFDEVFLGAEDWEFFFRVAKKGFRFDCAEEYLVKYRVHGVSLCDNYEKSEKYDLLAIDKIYSNTGNTDELKKLKKKALFLIYNEYAWHYFSKNEKDRGRERLLKAIEVYPEGFMNREAYFYIAQCTLPRGYRTREEVYKKISYVKKILWSSFSELDIDSKNLKRNILLNLNIALAWMFYFKRDMREARNHFLRAFMISPLYLFNYSNAYTLIKSLLPKWVIERFGNKRREKKILYFLDIFPAISETFIINEILELERKGFDILIFARKKEHGFSHGILRELKAQVFYLPDAHGLGTKELMLAHLKILFLHPFDYLKTFIFALKRRQKGLFWFFKVACFYVDLIRKYKFSHIHSHFASNASCYAMFVGKLLNKSFTFTIHGIHDLYVAPPEDLKDRIEAAQKVITISKYNKRYLIDKFDVPKRKIEVIHCGVDLNCFTSGHRKNGRNKTILSVARLDKVKGLDTLIHSCAILSKKISDFKCLIIGDGNERDYLKSLIDNLGLQDRVLLMGKKRLEEVSEYYKNASLFVLPSRQETMGVATMEAMASGLPVVSTHIYGIPELVKHRLTGFLIFPGDKKGLARYLEELLQDDTKRDMMGKMGRKKIEKEFNLVREVNKLTEVWSNGKN